MVPSDRISQNVGSKQSKSKYFRRKCYKNKNKIPPECLPFQFRPIIYACTKKSRKTSVVEPFLRLWWLNVESHFIAFSTGKMSRPRNSLKLGQFGPGFHQRNVDQSFGRRINGFSTNLYCPFPQHERF